MTYKDAETAANAFTVPAAKSNVTDIAVKSGSEAIVTALSNTTHTLTVANATLVSGLKAAIEATDSSVQIYTVTDASDATKADSVALVTEDKCPLPYQEWLPVH